MKKNWKLNHIATVVGDMDKAVEYYESLGIATFESEYILDNCIKIRKVHIGPVTLEFVQPFAKELRFRFKEFLDSKGEGIHHIGFYVDDLDEEIAEMVDKGVPFAWGKRSQAGRSVGLDTRKVGNLIIELTQQVE